MANHWQAATDPELELSEEEFGQIRDILLQDTGFDVERYKNRCIRRRIVKRIASLGLGSAEYLLALRLDGRERQRLLATLTVHVSQFFRNPSTFAHLQQRILPQLIAGARAEGRKTLRLWSIGCAGGEEPFSLALLLESVAPRDLTFSILATDISPRMLELGRQGLFDPVRLTEVPAMLRERYFTPEGRFYRLHPRVREQVHFELRDLMAPDPLPPADLILCRNVLIYFSPDEQERALFRLAEALPAGGYLVLGRTECLLGGPRRHFAPESPTEHIYRKLLDGEPGRGTPAAA